MIGSADVERIAHRHHQDPALVLEADRHQPKLLGRIGRHHPKRSLVGFAAEISAHDAGLLRQRANQDLLCEKLHADQDVAQLATPLLLLGQGGLELKLGDHTCPDEQVTDPDPHPNILVEARMGQQIPGNQRITALPRLAFRGELRAEMRLKAAVFRPGRFSTSNPP